MVLTDKEKLALLEVAYEPDEGENIHIVFEKVGWSVHPRILGVFTDEQHSQANVLSKVECRSIITIKANTLIDGGVKFED